MKQQKEQIRVKTTSSALRGESPLIQIQLLFVGSDRTEGYAFIMAAIKRASWLLLIGLLAACKAQETEQKPPLPDVSLLDLYKNITEVAAIAASLKTCAPDDAICIALKDLLTPPPPAGPPAYAPGPSQRVCRESLEL